MKRILLWLQLIGRRHYENRIGVGLAWELSGIFSKFDFENWESVKGV